MKRAIVTGATGMIGWNLIKYLVGKDIEVLAIVNPASTRKGYISGCKYVTIIESDLKDLMQIPIEKHYDYFFHLGWKGTHGNAREDLYMQEENVRNSLIAADFAYKAGCSVFVGAGSQAEYGSGYRQKLNGNLPARPETGYGIGKYMAGIMTGKRCHQLGIRHVWVRILSVYGPGDGMHTMVMSGIRKMLDGVSPDYTKGEQQWDYLYVKDAVEALYLLAEYGMDQKVYCLGSGKARPLREYIMDIRDLVNPDLKVKIGALPYPENQVMYLCADIVELEQDIGFTAKTPFVDGIRETIQWLREKGTYEKD